ncbi:MAG TPA: glycosyltransferase [Stellaceae bacterium]|nr:glycosyltransferase [Stellaceae bacterium]
MKVLQATQSPPEYIPPPLLDPEQVICGPNYPDRSDGDRIRSLHVERGDLDIARVVARIPREQRPELIVVRVDSSKMLLPRNLAALSCRRVLLVGDTHHDAAAITSIVDYAVSEPYDLVLLDYTRQHAHFFIEAGLKQVYWLPGFNVARSATPAVAVPDVALSFVGNVGNLYPRRTHLMSALHFAGLPIWVVQAPRAEARILHARSQVSLNCSLNGDLNLRLLEILESGGFLLTDRLGRESGLDLLFEEGQHYAGYGGIEECVEQCRRYLGDRAGAAQIARQGKIAFERQLAPERIRADFFALLERGVVRPEFALARDPRVLRRRRVRAVLRPHIAIYELLQALQHARESVGVLATTGIDPSILWDAHDLARVRIALLAGDTDRVTADLPPGILQDGTRSNDPLDVLLSTLAEWRLLRDQGRFARLLPGVLILCDTEPGIALAAEVRRSGFEPLTDRVPAFGRVASP